MRFTLILAAAALVLTACGTETSPKTAETSNPVVGTGKTADYQFTSDTLDGERFDGATLAGKPTVLWFWAPWCPTCRAQIGNISKLAKEYDGTVAVIGVGGLDNKDAIRDLARQIPYVTHLIDNDGDVWEHFRITAQSTYTVIGADGEIKAEGYLDDAELNAIVAQLAG